jgi:hypothetical protein
LKLREALWNVNSEMRTRGWLEVRSSYGRFVGLAVWDGWRMSGQGNGARGEGIKVIVKCEKTERKIYKASLLPKDRA